MGKLTASLEYKIYSFRKVTESSAFHTINKMQALLAASTTTLHSLTQIRTHQIFQHYTMDKRYFHISVVSIALHMNLLHD